MDVHVSQMKICWDDPMMGRDEQLFFFLPTFKPQVVTPGEWKVENISEHKMGKDGRLIFRTRWEDGSVTWEPAGNFITQYCAELVQYCKAHKLRIDLTTSLSGVLAE